MNLRKRLGPWLLALSVVGGMGIADAQASVAESAPIFGSYRLIRAINHDCFLIANRETQTLELLPSGVAELDPGVITVAMKSQRDGGYTLKFSGKEGRFETPVNPRGCFTVVEADLGEGGSTLATRHEVFCQGSPEPSATVFRAQFELDPSGGLLVDFGPTRFGEPRTCQFVKR